MARSRFRKSCGRISGRTRFGRPEGRASARPKSCLMDRDQRKVGRAEARPSELRFSVLPGKQIQLAGIGGGGCLGGGKRELEAEAVREALAGLGRKTFEMIVHETPDAA